MASIFASRFYAANQTKIATAVNDPKNRELVQQVASYLSKEDQAKLASMIKEEREEATAEEAAERSVEDTPMSPEASPRGGSHSPMSFGHSNMGGGSSDFGDLSEDLGDLPDADEPIDLPDTDTPANSEDVDLESSTKIYQMGDNKVIAATQATEELTEDSIQKLLEEKGAEGVRRVDFLDDGEIWIYYLDTTNLNNIMEAAISAVTNKYKFIEFNRLARTSNAIVFTFKQA